MHIFSDKKVKTRKKHECFACNRMFPKGSKMRCQINNYDGDMASVYWCETCESLCNEFHNKFYDKFEGIYPYSIVNDSIYEFMDGENLTPEDLLKYLRETKT